MRTNSQLGPRLAGKALEKPPAFFKNDLGIARWVRRAVRKIEPGGCVEDPSFQLACLLAASSVVGPDEDRIVRMLGLRPHQVALWTSNLRRGGIWKADTVCCGLWFDEQCGRIDFGAAMLVAEGLVESSVDETGEIIYRAVAGPVWWKKN
jgi:hypothetical protein